MMTTDYRRVARLVQRYSSDWVILRLMRAALDSSWEPAAAAKRLVAELPGPPHGAELLRLARTRLWLASGDRATLHRLRALAALNLALTELEDAESTKHQDAGFGPAGDGVTHAEAATPAGSDDGSQAAVRTRRGSPRRPTGR